MKYATYSKYKPSPMTWLDQLPTHWNAASLRWMSKRYAGGTPDKGNEAYWEGGDIPWVNSGAVNDGYITLPSELITREGFANSSAKWIPKDALVMALAGQGKTKGMVAQLGIPTTCNQSMAALIPDHRFAPRYLYYWLCANYQNIRNLAGGEARDGLNLEMLGSIPCLVPPLDEQQTIARFLGAKSAQIDELIVKKRQLIVKLKEKRSALIARTVTRGLPPEAAKAAGLEPNPEMKDSGVAWLGRIPHLWAPVPLGYLVKMRGGATPDKGKPEYWDGEIPWVSPKDMKVPRIFDAEDHISDEGLRNSPLSLIPNESLLIVVRGMILAHSFPVALSMRELTINQDMKALVCSRRICPEYLYWALCGFSSALVALTDESAHGTKKIEATILAKFPILVPPITEQQAITTYLRRETKLLDQLSTRIEAAVSRLTEYRQALITSAVTGKIDVRNWQSELEAA